MNETVKLKDQVVCLKCGEAIVEELAEKDVELDVAKLIERQVDPTVCVFCEHDNEETELEKVAGLPACPRCAQNLRRRPFPLWVKIALFVVLALTAFSLVRNRRFFFGYGAMKKSFRAAAKGDFTAAAHLMESAQSHVPESRELHISACYFRAVSIIRSDGDCAEAIRLLEPCRRFFGPAMIDPLLDAARISEAFKKGDYDRFLKLALASLRKEPKNPMQHARVASAYACKYAETGDDRLKEESLAYLKKAEKLTTPEMRLPFQEYRDRILYRLETREILTRQEYYNRFPDKKKKAGR
jgi:hypothetical protein